MKILVVLFLIFNIGLFGNFEANCAYSTTSRMNSTKITSLEEMSFGKSFVYDTTTTRLKRLEEYLFGAIQTGSNTQRVKRIEKYLNNSYQNNYYGYKVPTRNRIMKNYSYQDPITGKTYTRVKRNLRNLSKMFYNGTLTGITPPVQYNPIYNNMNNFDNFNTEFNTYGEEREYCDSFGRCTTDYNDRGSNMGVKIIY